MINNLELNKGKLSKLTRKVILVGGMISTLLTGGCKTKENSSNNTSITEVTPTPTETPEGGFVTATEKWQPHVPDSPAYDEGRSDMTVYRLVEVFKRYVYFDYDELMNALNNMDYLGPNFNYVFGNVTSDNVDELCLDVRLNYKREIPSGEENFYMVQGYVNVRKKVKVKSK